MDVTSYLLGKQAGGGSTPALQNKSVTITENGTTNVTADTGYDGLSQVEVTTNVSGEGNVFEYIYDTIKYNSTTSTLGVFLFKKLPEITLESTVTNLSYAFKGWTLLVELNTIKNTSQVTSISNMCENCLALKKAPQMDTSGVTNMTSAFAYCGKLEDVPQYNFTSVTAINNMFRYCSNLTDESLDNILISCISAINYTGTKTLKTMGFASSVYPVSRIEALPHYQDFLNAGWTIGY